MVGRGRVLRAGEQGARRSADGRRRDRLGRADAERHAAHVARRRGCSPSRSCVGLARRRRADMLIAVALLAMAAIPWTAFLDGHPFRIRYMVPLMAIEAIGAGLVGWRPARPPRACGRRGGAPRPRRVRAPAARRVGADGRRSAVGSAERAGARARDGVPRSAVRRREDHGEHGIARPLHAGGVARPASRFAIFCTKATATSGWPRSTARARSRDWVLIEEKAEGGDMLAQQRARAAVVSRRLRASVRGGGARAVSEQGLGIRDQD